MSKFKNGLLTFLGALLATVVRGILIAFLDILGTIAIETTLVSQLIQQNNLPFLCMLSLTTYALIHGISALVTDKLISVYCHACKTTNEHGIRSWLLFTVLLSGLLMFPDGLSAVNTCAVVGMAVPSYAFLRYRPYIKIDSRKNPYHESVVCTKIVDSDPVPESRKQPKRSKFDLVLAFVLGMLFGALIFMAINSL